MDKVELALPGQKQGHPSSKGQFLPLPHEGSSSLVLRHLLTPQVCMLTTIFAPTFTSIQLGARAAIISLPNCLTIKTPPISHLDPST